MPTIAFNQVSVSYDDFVVLQDVSITLNEHRIGIIGPNGGGKSTLVRLINGLSSPTAGKVTVDTVDPQSNGKEVRKRVGFVFSDAENQIVMPTVAEDIAFSLRRMKLPKAEKQQRVTELLERFGLAAHRDSSPHTLSGGQKQLLALAAVLAIQPDLIIADEPTTLLDLRNRYMIRQVFKELPQQLIVVTHDLDFVQDFDRALWIDNNRIVADGKPETVIQAYQESMKNL